MKLLTKEDRLLSENAQLQAELSQAKNALQRAEAKLKAVFQQALDVILILDSDSGQILDANKVVEQVLGYALDDIIGEQLIIDMCVYTGFVKNGHSV